MRSLLLFEIHPCRTRDNIAQDKNDSELPCSRG